MAYENLLANPHTGDKTVVAVTDDGQNGQVYFYYGDKQSTGSAIDKAGLTGGHLFGIKVADFAATSQCAELHDPAGCRRAIRVHLGRSRRCERHDRRADRPGE